jgi:hypothetical protein
MLSLLQARQRLTWASCLFVGYDAAVVAAEGFKVGCAAAWGARVSGRGMWEPGRGWRGWALDVWGLSGFQWRALSAQRTLPIE